MVRKGMTALIITAAGVLLLACGPPSADPTASNAPPSITAGTTSLLVANGTPKDLANGSFIGSFRSADGTIYLHEYLKTTDGGLTVTPQDYIDVEDITYLAACIVLAKPGLFYALNCWVDNVSPGVYSVKAWRSTDELKTLQEETARIYVPSGPTRPRNADEWYGLYVHRTIIEMPSGSWLMTMQGNFAEDELTPQDPDAQRETTFMMRSFTVESTDEGRTWHYLGDIAVPKAGDPVGEGYVEPAIALLDDGRLLCVMRAGHNWPLYASWSSDGGRTWTSPVNTGLDHGCEPCLLTLADGRIALSWGRRYPDEYTNLAISDDGGSTWINHPLAKGTGSCYSTIFEVEPNVLFFQVDGWYWRTTLVPKDGSGTSPTTTTTSTLPSAQRFRDVPPSHPYYEQIADLAARGVINGFPDGTFRPDGSVTRQQFAKMAVLSLQLPVSEADTCFFVDVEESGPGSFYPDNYVAACVSHGIAQGTGQDAFSPGLAISRAQVVTMVIRGVDNTVPGVLSEPPAGYEGSLGDFDQVHSPNIKVAECNGLLDGVLGFGPGWDPWRAATRAEVASLLSKLVLRISQGIA